METSVEFFRRIDVNGPIHPVLKTRCWVWKGARTTKQGYGMLGRRLAHRLSYVISGRPIPEGLGVLHHCDNPWCVNPIHLWVGTALDNNRDKMAKGRHVARRGEESGRAKLLPDQVAQIRVEHKQGASLRTLAAKFKIGKSQVSRIVRREKWVHLPSE